MYLISAYFDDSSNQKIQNLIEKVAKKSGNPFMIGKNFDKRTNADRFSLLTRKFCTFYGYHHPFGTSQDESP